VIEKCAGCGAKRDLAATDDVATWLAIAFTILNGITLLGAGWSCDGERWWCVHCTRRRRLVRLVPDAVSDVTKAPPATEETK
jgi:hypothetical protein